MPAGPGETSSRKPGKKASEVSATRGHLVRQAVQDGLLPDMNDLIAEDGTIDLVCDPGMEIPLELDNRTFTLTELFEVLQDKRVCSLFLGETKGSA